MNTVRVDASGVESFVTDVVTALGARREVAAQVAESLVTADLRGHNSHGVARAVLYAEMIDDGAIDPTATPEVVREDDTTANVDGRSQFGQVVGRKAIEVGVEKANDAGVAAVGVRDAAHLGRIGEWSERVASEGLVLVAFVNTQGGAQTVGPAGSADRLLSTNPISVSVPTFDALEFDIVLDIATSQVANGKIYEKEAADEQIPEGWTTKANGEPVLDPHDFIENEIGAMLPLGGRVSGYKGFGLGVIVELLASNISDGIATGETDPEWFNNAACFLFVDPRRFTSRERIEERVTAFADRIRSATRSSDIPVGVATKADRALLPGELEHQTTVENRQKGIELPAATIKELNEFAAEIGVDHRLE